MQKKIIALIQVLIKNVLFMPLTDIRLSGVIEAACASISEVKPTGKIIKPSSVKPIISFFLLMSLLAGFTFVFLSAGNELGWAEASPRKKIVIDAGHGGTDPGAVSFVVEKEVVLRLSMMLYQRLLEKYDVDVLMIREVDETVTLRQRTDAANAWGADFFFSIHNNASGGSGYEDFIFNGTVCNETVRIRDVIHDYIAPVWVNAGRPNRGKKTANFHVLRETNMPAMLVEHGFVDNQVDAALLTDDTFIHVLVDSMVQGIAAAMNLPPSTDNGSIGGGVLQPPVINVPDGWTSLTQVSVEITGEIGESEQIQYRLHGTENRDWTDYRGIFNIAKEGLTIVEARVIDPKQGLVSAYRSEVVMIDRTSPGETMLEPETEIWTSENVKVNLTAGEDLGPPETGGVWHIADYHDFTGISSVNLALTDGGGTGLPRWREAFEGSNRLTMGSLPGELSDSAARTGRYGLKANSFAAHAQLLHNAVHFRGDDFYYTGWVRTDSGYQTTGLSGLSFGVPSSADLSGYQALIDVRNGTGNSAAFQVRRNFSVVLASDSNIRVEVDRWYKIEIRWDSSGSINAMLYNEKGERLSSLTVQDQLYIAGLIGVAAHSNSSFDDLEYGLYIRPHRDVIIGRTSSSAPGDFHHVLIRAEKDFSGDMRLLPFNNITGFHSDGVVELAEVDDESGGGYRLLREVPFMAGQQTVTLENVELYAGHYYVIGHTNGHHRYPVRYRPSGEYMTILKSAHVRGEVGTDPYMRTYGFAEYIFIEKAITGTGITGPFLTPGFSQISNSVISWEYSQPNNTGVNVAVSYDGQEWLDVENGGAVPGRQPETSYDGSAIFLRALLTTADPARGPSIWGITVKVTGTVATSGTSHVAYLMDSSGNWQVTTDGEITVTTEGEQIIMARTVDMVGNTGSESSVTVRIDRTPPEATLRINEEKIPAGSVSLFPERATINIEASDGLSGVQSVRYSLDDGQTWHTYAEQFVLDTSGRYSLLVMVADYAGNTVQKNYILTIGEEISPPDFIAGDVDGNGMVDVNDVILLLRHIVGKISLDSLQIQRALVSGRLANPDVGDAVIILRMIVGF